MELADFFAEATAVVFNNPFDSFHDTVAKAKEEREQLDRLLTISTPRERLLVAGIALLLVALAAWLVFGDVARSHSVDGVLIEPGESLGVDSESVQALVWIESEFAPNIKAGLPAVIELVMADGEAATRDGEVASVSAVPLSGSLATLEGAAPVLMHRIEIALDAGLDIASLASRECRIVIELGRQSPVAFLQMRRS